MYDRGRVSKLEPNIIRGSPSSQTPYAHSSLLPIFSAHNRHTITRNTTDTQLQKHNRHIITRCTGLGYFDNFCLSIALQCESVWTGPASAKRCIKYVIYMIHVTKLQNILQCITLYVQYKNRLKTNSRLYKHNLNWCESIALQCSLHSVPHCESMVWMKPIEKLQNVLP